MEGRVVASFAYDDGTDKIIARVFRIEPGRDGRSKNFFCRTESTARRPHRSPGSTVSNCRSITARRSYSRRANSERSFSSKVRAKRISCVPPLRNRAPQAQ